jgi:hypothetical protein
MMGCAAILGIDNDYRDGPADAGGSVGGGSATAATSSGGAIVDCDGGQCAAGQVCCTKANGPQQCGPNGGCPSGFGQFACDGPEDCPGELCCYVGVDAQPIDGFDVHCAATCSGANELVECHTNGDCPKGHCIDSPYFAGMRYCN